MRDNFQLVHGEDHRLNGYSDWIELYFVERERTPHQLMKFGIRLHLTELSLLIIFLLLGIFGVKRSQKAVDDRV